MRNLLLAGLLSLPTVLLAQQPASESAPTPAQVQSDLATALVGDWVGILEYRDYSEPATSTKRVQLPTWLSISATSPTQTTWRYIYDDGPTKTVTETDVVTFDPASSSYSEVDNGKPALSFQVSGYATLKSGRGTLILSGHGTDNDKPAESRITLTIRRNLLDFVEETRAVGSSDPFVFRHKYTFTRAKAPVTKP